MRLIRMRWSPPHSLSSTTSSRCSGRHWRESTGSLLPRVKVSRVMEDGQARDQAEEAGAEEVDTMIDEEEEVVEVEAMALTEVVEDTEAATKMSVVSREQRQESSIRGPSEEGLNEEDSEVDEVVEIVVDGEEVVVEVITNTK